MGKLNDLLGAVRFLFLPSLFFFSSLPSSPAPNQPESPIHRNVTHEPRQALTHCPLFSPKKTGPPNKRLDDPTRLLHLLLLLLLLLVSPSRRRNLNLPPHLQHLHLRRHSPDSRALRDPETVPVRRSHARSSGRDDDPEPERAVGHGDDGRKAGGGAGPVDWAGCGRSGAL